MFGGRGSRAHVGHMELEMPPRGGEKREVVRHKPGDWRRGLGSKWGCQHKNRMVLTKQITSPRELRELEKRAKAEPWRLQH